MTKRTLQEAAFALACAALLFGMPALMSAAKLAGWW